MKAVVIASGFFFSLCLTASGQTNSTQVPHPPLPVPALELRPVSESDPASPALGLFAGEPQLRLVSELGKPETFNTPVGEPATIVTPPVPTEYFESDFDLKLYRRLEENGYLERPEPPSENLLVRYTDAIFVPDVVRVGKADVRSSILTAIKRRNPLCLLNPAFLQISW